MNYAPGQNSADEDDVNAPSKKARKPYTLTKQRESWSNEEHDRFIKALQMYNRDWKKIEAFVGTKTVVQIRSHAQKYFQKVIKSGAADVIPPPRPKRKASDPSTPAGANADKRNRSADTQQKSSSSKASGRHPSTAAAPTVEGKLQDAPDHHQHHHQESQPQPSTARAGGDLEVSAAQLEACKSAISSQGLQRAYGFLLSMFEDQQTDHVEMLQSMPVRDRHIVHKLLNVLQEELSSASTGRPHSHSQQQQQQEHHQYHGEDSSNSRRRPGHRAARSRHARDGHLQPDAGGDADDEEDGDDNDLIDNDDEEADGDDDNDNEPGDEPEVSSSDHSSQRLAQAPGNEGANT
eukprot:jgi/Chrzof1/5563/Cz16g07200.t1